MCLARPAKRERRGCPGTCAGVEAEMVERRALAVAIGFFVMLIATYLAVV